MIIFKKKYRKRQYLFLTPEFGDIFGVRHDLARLPRAQNQNRQTGRPTSQGYIYTFVYVQY